MIKKSILHIVCAFLFLSPYNYHSINASNTIELDSESSGRVVDEFDGFDEFDDDDFLDIEGNNETRKTTANDILDILLGANALTILQEDFFLKTTQLNTRSLLDMPLLGSLQCSRKSNRLFDIDFFYNHTTRGNFTRTSTDLESYLALSSQTLIDKIQNTIKFFPIDPIDIKQILSLFKNMTTQQRRLGCMFSYMHQYKNTIIKCMSPFYYLERNLYLTPEQQADVEDDLGAANPEEAAKLQKKYFIGDRVGLGDLRVEIETPAIRHNLLHLNIGGQLTIPTAFTVQKGIMGSAFPKPCTLPILNIEELIALANNALIALANNATSGTEQEMQQAQEQGRKILEDFLLGALDRLSSNLIDTKLGNDGHLGIGLFYRSQSRLSSLIKRQWAHNIHFFSKVSLEYLFPGYEKRFYIKKHDPEEFAARNFQDADKALSNLEFLAEEIINKFYLVALNTWVQPGVTIHSTSKLCYQGVQWGAQIGSDFWLQTRAHLQTIKEPLQPSQHGRTIPLKSLDLKKAKPFFAYQSKLFAGLTCQIERPHAIWFTSLNVDSTLFNSGIGQDYTVSIKVERQF